MYSVMLVLNTGEILYLHKIKNVSWTRGRIIFIDAEDKAHTYLPGEIIKVVFDREVKMKVTDLLYSTDIRLGELLSLFLQGDDDKVYIYLYNGDDSNIIFEDIRIIDPKLNKYLNRQIIGLEMGKTLGIYLKYKEVHDDETN